jgi:ribokinase
VLNPAPARSNLDMDVVTQASFLIPNETELAILTGMPVESEAEVSAAAQSLVNKGVETVIVTLGARGALLATRAGARAIAPVKVQAVDTTGAGDAFIGSFARYLAGGLALNTALVEATRYSAFSVTRHGAQKSFAAEAEFAAFRATLG